MILPRGKLVHFLIPAMPRITSFLLLSSAILFLSLLTKKYISPTVGWQGWGCTLSLAGIKLGWAMLSRAKKNTEEIWVWFFPLMLCSSFSTPPLWWRLSSSHAHAQLENTKTCVGTKRTKCSSRQQTPTDACLLFSSGPPGFWRATLDCGIVQCARRTSDEYSGSLLQACCTVQHYSVWE